MCRANDGPGEPAARGLGVVGDEGWGGRDGVDGAAEEEEGEEGGSVSQRLVRDGRWLRSKGLGDWVWKGEV